MLGLVVLLSLVGVCVCVSSLQARVKNEILAYKDLAALPKVKAIYEVQQPDLICSSYQPYHRYTSDDRLDTYCYGEVLLLLLHTPGQTWHWPHHSSVFRGNAVLITNLNIMSVAKYFVVTDFSACVQTFRIHFW